MNSPLHFRSLTPTRGLHRSIICILSVSLGIGLASLSSAFDYNGTPVAWGVGTSETGDTVKLRIEQNWRPISIDATSPGSTASNYATCYVTNTGTHNKTVLMAENVTAIAISSYRRSGWRIEDIERTGSSTYSALFTKLSENPVPTGWFSDYTTEQVTSLLGSTRRLLELDSVVINGVRKFTGVWIDNSGNNAKAWGWMPGQSLEDIQKWASDNQMRITDLDPRGGGLYSAVFVRRAPGERVYIAAGSWNTVVEMQQSTGTRFQVLNKLEGQDWYAAVLVNNVGPQPARVADTLMNTAGGGRIGAYVQQINGPVLVDLRSTKQFYPCSAIKVLIHAAGLAAVPADQLDTYKVTSPEGEQEYLSVGATKMMENSDNPWTWALNQHFGYSYINQYGRDHLGTTRSTFIKWHYGDNPPDGQWNAFATLKDMTNIYAKRNVLGTAKVARFRKWMITEADSGLYNDLSQSLANSLGLTAEQYSAWKSRVKFEYKAGNVGLNGSSTTNLHWVNVGRVTLPFRSERGWVVSRSYVFGHFVNDSVTGYPKSVAKGHSAGLIREQLIDSLRTFQQ